MVTSTALFSLLRITYFPWLWLMSLPAILLVFFLLCSSFIFWCVCVCPHWSRNWRNDFFKYTQPGCMCVSMFMYGRYIAFAETSTKQYTQTHRLFANPFSLFTFFIITVAPVVLLGKLISLVFSVSHFSLPPSLSLSHSDSHSLAVYPLPHLFLRSI